MRTLTNVRPVPELRKILILLSFYDGVIYGIWYNFKVSQGVLTTYVGKIDCYSISSKE